MDPTPAFVRPPIVSTLPLAGLEPGVVHRFRVVMTENASGNETLVPVQVLVAEAPKPVVGVTAVVHGNELNGIPVVHRLIANLAEQKLLRGTIIAVPVVNVPGYLRKQREFEDGADLNRLMPGKVRGNESQVYAYRFVERVASHFDYLIDLHTASTGRANSLYVRADMKDPVIARMARLIGPQVIVHSGAPDGSLRAACAELGTRAITVEVGDPQRLQKRLARAARLGIEDVLADLGLIDSDAEETENSAIECSKSYWIYSDRGGMLQVLPEVASMVEEGDEIAKLWNVWGDPVRTYRAPERGVVIGKSTDPAARAGSRILHLGIVDGA